MIEITREEFYYKPVAVEIPCVKYFKTSFCLYTSVYADGGWTKVWEGDGRMYTFITLSNNKLAATIAGDIAKCIKEMLNLSSTEVGYGKMSNGTGCWVSYPAKYQIMADVREGKFAIAIDYSDEYQRGEIKD